MKNVLAICFFSLICTFTALNAQKAVTVNNTPEKVVTHNISWDHTTFDFGEIPQSVPAEAVFTLTNTSDQPLLLKEVKPTCGCTIAAYDQEPILPGESTTITTTYNAKKSGVFKKTIKVLTNQSEKPISLRLKGEVIEAKS